MKNPQRNGIPRYAIRRAIVEIRGEVIAQMKRCPDAHAYICHACDRVLSRPYYSSVVRTAVLYIKSYVQHKLNGCHTLGSWQAKNNRPYLPNYNDARVAWLGWMLEGIEREIEEKGRI